MHVVWVIAISLAVFVFILRYWCFWCRSKVCLVGKTALITGAASGLGLETALALASKGCRIIIADVVNVSQAVEKIKGITHNFMVLGKTVDLQSFKSVRNFAKDILETETKLDILVCNAGIGAFRIREVTEDGLEKTMQINYFSHFLLTHLLLDLLKKSAPSRIVFTSSQAAFFSDLSVKTLNAKPEYFKRLYTIFSGGVYSNSKLAAAAAVKSLGERLKGTGVKTYAVHPGVVNTGFVPKAIKLDRNFLMGPIFMLVTSTIAKNPEQGAQTLIHVAHADEVEHLSGHSFVEGRKVPRLLQLSDKFCEDIWDETIKLINMEPHEIAC